MNELLRAEDELAIKLVKQLDGIPIDKARNALERATELLSRTQIVSAHSPLLKYGLDFANILLYTSSTPPLNLGAVSPVALPLTHEPLAP